MGVEEGTFRGGGANALIEPSTLIATREVTTALGLLGEVTLSVQFVDEGRSVMLGGIKQSANVYRRGSADDDSALIWSCSAVADDGATPPLLVCCKNTVSQGGLTGARVLGRIWGGESQLIVREVSTDGDESVLCGPKVEGGRLQVLRWIDDEKTDHDDADAPLLGGAGASGASVGDTPPRVVWLQHTSRGAKSALLECAFERSDEQPKLCTAQWPVGKSTCLPPTFVGGGCGFAAFTHGAFEFEQLHLYALNTAVTGASEPHEISDGAGGEKSKLELIGGLRLYQGGGRDGISDVLIVRGRRREVRVYVATKIGELHSFTVPATIVSRSSKCAAGIGIAQDSAMLTQYSSHSAAAAAPPSPPPGFKESTDTNAAIRSPHLGKPATEKKMIKLVKYAMAKNGKFNERFWRRETQSSRSVVISFVDYSLFLSFVELTFFSCILAAQRVNVFNWIEQRPLLRLAQLELYGRHGRERKDVERLLQVCFYLPLHFKRILLTILTCPPHILTF